MKKDAVEDVIKSHQEIKDEMGSDNEGFHTPHGVIGADHANYDEQKQQQLAAFLSVLAQQTPLSQSTKQTSSTSAGPSNYTQIICSKICFKFI